MSEFVRQSLFNGVTHGNMDAVFPGLTTLLAQQGMQPVGMCLYNILASRPLCNCPAGMNLDKTGINCVGSTGERQILGTKADEPKAGVGWEEGARGGA